MSPFPTTHFQSLRYQRMNLRRLEHLALLQLPVDGRTVLELGAGVGDLTSFFLDRGCTVTSVEPRPENVAVFHHRYEDDPIWPAGRLRVFQNDVYDFIGRPDIEPHQIVFAYGLLYHLERPLDALANIAAYCRELLLLETVVSDRRDDSIAFGKEDAANVTNSITGGGCVPTRLWVFNRLREHFPFAYVPRVSPSHDQFRIEPDQPMGKRGRRRRAIFVAARRSLDNPLLTDRLELDVVAEK